MVRLVIWDAIVLIMTSLLCRSWSQHRRHWCFFAWGRNVSKTLTYYPWDQHKTSYLNNDDVIKWKYFPCYWPFVSKQSWGWWFETPSHPLCNVRLPSKVPFLWNANLWPIVAMKVVMISISSPNQDIQMRKSILCVHYRADTTDITHFHRQQTVSFNACN